MPAPKKPQEKKLVKKASAADRSPKLTDVGNMEKLLRGFAGKPGDKAAFEAKNIIYEAWEADNKRAVVLARKAIEKYPLCADAYVLMAERTATSVEQAKEWYRLAVEAGGAALGPKGFREYAGHFWGFLETRPYMRARAGLAEALMLLGQLDEAADHFKEMLKLNPNDNQGIRYQLIECLFKMKDEDALAQLLKDQEDDASAYTAYAQALLAYRHGGDSERAQKFAREAFESNRHIPAALNGSITVIDPKGGFYTWGGEDEAAYFLEHYGFAWRETPGAIEWLIKTTSKIKPQTPTGRRAH